MRSIMNEKLSDISEESKRKKKENDNSVVDTEVNISSTDRIKKQREMLKRGDVTELNLNRVKSTANDVFNSMYGMLNDRYDVDVKDQLERQNDDGKLYTLDPEEMKKDEDNLYDEKIQMNEYNRNMHDDLDTKVQVMQTTPQFIRTQQSHADNTVNDEMRYFFSHLR